MKIIWVSSDSSMSFNIKMKNQFYLLFFVTILLILIEYSTCFNSSSINNKFGYSPALATWYGDPNGAGSGGACGFANDVAYPPYSSMISAGNANIFKGGQGCGTCYMVKCRHVYCSGYPIKVTITDECPGACNAVAYHFDLSGFAFGRMAKRGLSDNLRNLGQVDIVYRRVPCYYPGTKIAFRIVDAANPYYIAMAIEYVDGEGDLDSVELGVGENWMWMRRTWGAVWKADINPSMKGPFSVKLTMIGKKKTLVAYNAIPVNWAPGQKYWSRVNYF